MLTAAIISTFAIFTALPAAAQSASVAPEPGQATVVLCPEVASRIAELARHGDRFAKAIERIRAEAARPSRAPQHCESTGQAEPTRLADK